MGVFVQNPIKKPQEVGKIPFIFDELLHYKNQELKQKQAPPPEHVARLSSSGTPRVTQSNPAAGF